MNRKKYPIVLGILLLFSLVILYVDNVFAAGNPEGNNPDMTDEYCLSCHDTPGLTMELSYGEQLYISIDTLTYYKSSHGKLGYACVQCHKNITEYPHPEKSIATVREYTLEMYENCRECHEASYEATLDSTHQKSLAEGNIEAAVCTDCHGTHNIGTPDDPRSNIPQMCRRCHSEIYTIYKESVHGSALIGDGNPDVPTCTDCHGVHRLTGPLNQGSFHLFSPQICAECHADDELMSQYGISTDVFDTYVADFHGTTVLLFEKIAPDQETNKPVCIDCHGVHNMRSVDDPESSVIKDNLLNTCQKCHPEATGNFPTSWLGHYKPSSEDAPLIYFVDLFYKIIIPVTIGGMLIFIASDVGKKVVNKLEHRNE